jgi:hypothetical protein
VIWKARATTCSTWAGPFRFGSVSSPMLDEREPIQTVVYLDGAIRLESLIMDGNGAERGLAPQAISKIGCNRRREGSWMSHTSERPPPFRQWMPPGRFVKEGHAICFLMASRVDVESNAPFIVRPRRLPTACSAEIRNCVELSLWCDAPA